MFVRHMPKISGCVTPSRCITTHHFQLLRTFWATVHATNNIRSAPASSVLTQVSHWSHNAYTANCHLHGSGERNGEQRRTKVSFDRTMMQALELLRLAIRHVSTHWTVKKSSQPLSSYSCLKALVRQSVSQWKILLNKRIFKISY